MKRYTLVPEFNFRRAHMEADPEGEWVSYEAVSETLVTIANLAHNAWEDPPTVRAAFQKIEGYARLMHRGLGGV